MSKITFIFIISNGNQPPVYSTLNVPCQVIKSLGPQGTFRKLLIITHEQQKHPHQHPDFNHRHSLTHLWARFLFRVSGLEPSQEDFASHQTSFRYLSDQASLLYSNVFYILSEWKCQTSLPLPHHGAPASYPLLFEASRSHSSDVEMYTDRSGSGS